MADNTTPTAKRTRSPRTSPVKAMIAATLTEARKALTEHEAAAGLAIVTPDVARYYRASGVVNALATLQLRMGDAGDALPF